jgi:hypothetical protein
MTSILVCLIENGFEMAENYFLPQKLDPRFTLTGSDWRQKLFVMVHETYDRQPFKTWRTKQNAR